MSLLQDGLILVDADYVPPQTVSTSNLDDSTFDHQLAEDAPRLVNLYMDKELAFAVNPVSRQQGLSAAEAAKFLFVTWQVTHAPTAR